jgi:hypothetical protein
MSDARKAVIQQRRAHAVECLNQQGAIISNRLSRVADKFGVDEEVVRREALPHVHMKGRHSDFKLCDVDDCLHPAQSQCNVMQDSGTSKACR